MNGHRPIICSPYFCIFMMHGAGSKVGLFSNFGTHGFRPFHIKSSPFDGVVTYLPLGDKVSKEESCMESILNWSAVISLIGILVVLTNIITQIVKKVTWEKLPTNILVVIISMALTLAAFFAYCQIKAIAVVWYMVIAAIVLGFLVSYAAMFGFDKLKEALAQIGKQ